MRKSQEEEAETDPLQVEQADIQEERRPTQSCLLPHESRFGCRIFQRLMEHHYQSVDCEFQGSPLFQKALKDAHELSFHKYGALQVFRSATPWF